MAEYLADMWNLAAEGEAQGISFYAAVYALVVLSASTWYQIRITSWPRTQGVLLNATLEKFGSALAVTSNQQYWTKAFYEYAVNGSLYRGTRISPWVIVATHNARFVLRKQLDKIHRDEDGKIAVYYNPKDPAKSFLVKPWKPGIAITLLFAMIPMVAYFVAYES